MVSLACRAKGVELLSQEELDSFNKLIINPSNAGGEH
jgi:hypothetical protein